MPPLQRIAPQIADYVKGRIINQIKLQGHNLTGKLIASVSYTIQYTPVGIGITFMMENYGAILDKGVKASRIPFSPNSGAKKSKYIEGLKKYARIRFFADDKRALQIAFAIAHAHKRDGMPSKGSFRFSKTGKRTNFIEEALKDSNQTILKLLGTLEFDVLEIAA